MKCLVLCDLCMASRVFEGKRVVPLYSRILRLGWEPVRMPPTEMDRPREFRVCRILLTDPAADWLCPTCARPYRDQEVIPGTQNRKPTWTNKMRTVVVKRDQELRLVDAEGRLTILRPALNVSVVVSVECDARTTISVAKPDRPELAQRLRRQAYGERKNDTYA